MKRLNYNEFCTRRGVLRYENHETLSLSMTDMSGVRIEQGHSRGIGLIWLLPKPYFFVSNRVQSSPISLRVLQKKVREKKGFSLVLSRSSQAEDVAEFVRLLWSELQDLGIRHKQILYDEQTLSKHVFTSSGLHAITKKLSAVVRIGMELEKGHVIWRQHCGIDPLKMRRNLKSYVEDARSIVKCCSSAVVLKPRKTVAVLSPEATSILIHEAFGHLVEADSYLSGNVLSAKLGHRIASSKLTVVDEGNMREFGWCPCDDEGSDSRKLELIRKGVLEQCMHDVETAERMEQLPTGNARAHSFRYKPFIRMRNTYLQPSTTKSDEIIAETKEGVYLTSPSSIGSVFPDGSFSLLIQCGYLIHKGEVDKALRPIMIHGNAVETLATLDLVGNDFAIYGSKCLKYGKHAVDVSMGGPTVRCIVHIR